MFKRAWLAAVRELLEVDPAGGRQCAKCGGWGGGVEETKQSIVDQYGYFSVRDVRTGRQGR